MKFQVPSVRDVSVMFQEVSKKFQGSFKSVSREFLGSFKED